MLDRTSPPVAGKISNLKLEKAESFKLGNGIPVHVISSGSHDVIHLEIICKSGKWYEPANGVSHFASKMLIEGTDDRSSKEIAEYFEFYGAYISVTGGLEVVNISVYTLNSCLDKIIKFLIECLTEASYPKEELNTLIQIQKEQLKVQNKKNDYVASKIFRSTLFGPDHPYGKSMEVEDIDSNITRNRIINYFRDSLYNQAEIFLSGNIGIKERKSIELFEGFPLQIQTTPKHHPIYEKGKIIKKEDKDSLQASIRYGNICIPKTDKEIHGFVILNKILGGFFGSRLMKNLREDKGYTYGIYSSIINHMHDSYFVIGADVKKEFRDDTILEINNEIDLLKNSLVNDDELETVKSYMLGSFLTSMETSFSLADKFKGVYFYDLDYSFYDRYIDTINTITSEQLLALANKYLNVDEFNLVIVG